MHASVETVRVSRMREICTSGLKRGAEPSGSAPTRLKKYFLGCCHLTAERHPTRNRTPPLAVFDPEAQTRRELVEVSLSEKDSRHFLQEVTEATEERRNLNSVFLCYLCCLLFNP